MPTTPFVWAVTDALVNRRDGRFDITVDGDELVLHQNGDEERIGIGDIAQLEVQRGDGRVRLRFRTGDGAAWTLRWSTDVDSGTALLLERLGLAA